MIEYKAKWFGHEVKKIGSFEPSSKTCSHCGHKHNELKLQDRAWVCSNCNTYHHRDENAAKNIMMFSFKESFQFHNWESFLSCVMPWFGNNQMNCALTEITNKHCN